MTTPRFPSVEAATRRTSGFSSLSARVKSGAAFSAPAPDKHASIGSESKASIGFYATPYSNVQRTAHAPSAKGTIASRGASHQRRPIPTPVFGRACIARLGRAGGGFRRGSVCALEPADIYAALRSDLSGGLQRIPGLNARQPLPPQRIGRDFPETKLRALCA